MTPTVILAILLAISVAGNGLLSRLYLSQRDETTQAQSELKNATSAATTCSDRVKELASTAQAQQRAASAAIAAARAKARTNETRAVRILATAPTKPGDDCGSAQDRLDLWWMERGKP